MAAAQMTPEQEAALEALAAEHERLSEIQAQEAEQTEKRNAALGAALDLGVRQARICERIGLSHPRVQQLAARRNGR